MTTRAAELAMQSQEKAVSRRARAPVRPRGRLRFDALLDATADLLARGDDARLSLHGLAIYAGVPPASVYHFFPSWGAAKFALASRYISRLTELLDESEARDDVRNWAAFIRERFGRATQFFNANPVFSGLVLGGDVSADIRRLDTEAATETSRLSYQTMSKYFVLPVGPDYEQEFAVLVAIFDGIAMASYARHGNITSVFSVAAEEAGVAYCKTFLPDILEIRTKSEM